MDEEKHKLIPALQEHKNTSLFAEEFEKDNDHNGHIDFIYSFGNLRAQNYQLDRMDWITVKLKAGRIVPAMATTTAVIAGLQTIELCKVMKKCKLEEMKNGFVNLAIPYIQLTEPGEAPKIKLNAEVSVTAWDKWEIKEGKQLSLKQIFEKLESQYKVRAVACYSS